MNQRGSETRNPIPIAISSPNPTLQTSPLNMSTLKACDERLVATNV